MSYFGSIYSDQTLTGRAKNVYRYLADRANTDGQCWPSERKIAIDLGISKSTVKRAVEDLKRNRYITVEKRVRQSGANSSLMFVLTNFSKHHTTTG